MYCYSLRAVAAALLTCVVVAGLSPSARADNTPIIISGESGGEILNYAIRMATYEKNHDVVRFEGRCDSACTMLLALPTEQTCIAPGAYFRFHAPYGGTEKQNAIALDFLLETYPDWVKSWIAENGYLTKKLIKMDYDHAKKFLNPCEQTVAAF